MSSDNQNNNSPPTASGSNSNNASSNANNPNDMSRTRRGSITSAAFTNLFQRSNSTSTGTPVMPGPITTAAMNDQRRRLSVSTVGLGTSPTAVPTPYGFRRGSISTNGSDSIDENAVDEDDSGSSARTAPTTPFTRRMSFGAQAIRNMRPGGGTSPGSNDQGFNWSEQLRSRAESTVTGSRPSFSYGTGLSASPPRGSVPQPHHDRAKSVSDMPAPPAQASAVKAKERPKPDAFQERILKGDFYMD